MNLNFQKNIVNLNGRQGANWLEALPDVVEDLKSLWSLDDVQEVENLTWNYLFYATQDEKNVVVKVSFDAELIENEWRALNYFNGEGVVRVFDISREHQALLLERVAPGLSLKSQRNDHLYHHYAHVLLALSNKPSKISANMTMFDWANAIERISDLSIDKDIRIKAQKIQNRLFKHQAPLYFCHGDLHLDNILQRENTWCAIDPKGVLGETAFEAAAFDLLTEAELMSIDSSERLIPARIERLAKTLHLSNERLLQWFFLRCLISAQWFIEDGGDPKQMFKLAKLLYRHL